MKKVQARTIPAGAGKSELTVANLVPLTQTCFVTGIFVISKDSIETKDFSGVLESIGPKTNPEKLRTMAGSTLLAVHGFGEREEEIFEIPEVREFFRIHCRQWSPWLFCGTIFSADLLAIVLCCLPSVSCLRQDGELIVAWKTEEMQAFLEHSLPTAAWLHNRARVDRNEGRLMLEAAAAYLGLPFEGME